jgi:hypothetical protein
MVVEETSKVVLVETIANAWAAPSIGSQPSLAVEKRRVAVVGQIVSA